MSTSSALHPDHTHCIPNLFTRFLLVFQHMLPVYAALHFIPQLIFKRRLLFSRPVDVSEKDILSSDPPKRTRKGAINWKELTKLLWRGLKGTLRSGSFLSGFVVIFHGQSLMFPLPKSPKGHEAVLIPFPIILVAQRSYACNTSCTLCSSRADCVICLCRASTCGSQGS